MNDFPEGMSDQADGVADVERRLRAVHDMVREATASHTGDDLDAIFADAERAQHVVPRVPGSS